MHNCPNCGADCNCDEGERDEDSCIHYEYSDKCRLDRLNAAITEYDKDHEDAD